jgi:hypothetical protein
VLKRDFRTKLRKRPDVEIKRDLEKLKLDIVEGRKKLDQMVENDRRLKLVKMHEAERAREAAEKAEAERAHDEMMERESRRFRGKT